MNWANFISRLFAAWLSCSNLGHGNFLSKGKICCGNPIRSAAEMPGFALAKARVKRHYFWFGFY